MITTLRTAAAEIRRAIADSGAAILAAWFGPVLADIASSVRTDAVAWLAGYPERRGAPRRASGTRGKGGSRRLFRARPR